MITLNGMLSTKISDLKRMNEIQKEKRQTVKNAKNKKEKLTTNNHTHHTHTNTQDKTRRNTQKDYAHKQNDEKLHG